MYENWIGDAVKSPLAAKKIADALFGGEPEFRDWDDDLEAARLRSKGKGKNRRNITYESVQAELEKIEASTQLTFHPTGHFEKRELAGEARDKIKAIIDELDTRINLSDFSGS